MASADRKPANLLNDQSVEIDGFSAHVSLATACSPPALVNTYSIVHSAEISQLAKEPLGKSRQALMSSQEIKSQSRF